MMKSFSKLMFATLLATGFWACSDEVDVPDNGGTETKDKVYMSFDLQLPTATRSETDDSGTTNSDANPDSEEGQTSENTVSSVVVVLATYTTGTYPTYTYLTHSKTGYNLAGQGTSYTVTFEPNGPLESAANQNVAVFVICNPPSDFEANKLFDGGTDAKSTGSITSDNLTSNIASANNFLMANKSITKIQLPSSDDMYKKHNTPGSAFFLGTVEVERTVARFDFRAWGELDANGNQLQDNKYTVETKSATDNTATVQVVLTDMALLNLSKEYYYLRRVAANSSANNAYDTDAITICGDEVNNNFVVDTDAATKLSSWSNLSSWTADTYLLYNMGSASSVNLGTLWTTVSKGQTTSITEIVKGFEDKWDNATETTDQKTYRFWRYATENTMPSVNSQIQAFSTAVLFKGKIVTTESTDTRLSGTKAYVLKNVLYGTWEQVKSKVESITASETNAGLLELKSAYETAAATMEENATEPSKADAVDAGFTVYERDSTEDDFEVYYYYKNRHNDNNNPTTMGIMEYAVVRNNVYKLTVESISKFGHPADPAGDPDPIDPSDPDEEKVVYFTVSVRVLPWVVRVNNIEF